MFKKLFTLTIALLPLICFAQSGGPRSEFPAVDKSPLDVSYYPVNYPTMKNRNADIGPLAARVIYSRPEAKNRPIFGELIPYGKVWRLGANENTEVEFFKAAKVDGQSIKPGRYSLFALVEKDSWTIIFNKDLDSWGAFSYNEANDVLRVKIPVEQIDEHVENLAIYFKDDNGKASLNFAWEKTKVSLPVQF